VGKIRAALKKLGFDDNTVVIFTSDNGKLFGDHGLAGKWLMYEESIRVPMVVCDPRLPTGRKGKRCEEMALTIDMAPTMLAMAGAPVPSAMQGRDLTPLLEGKKIPWREDWFYEHTFTLAKPLIAKTVGVRTKRWKYTRYVCQDPPYEQFFDLKSLPIEEKNLVGVKEYGDILVSLRKRCDEYLRVLR